MKSLLTFIITAIVISSCSSTEKHKPVVNPDEVAALLNPENTRRKSYIQTAAFWENKIDQQNGGFLYMQKLGQTYAGAFATSGNIAWIHRSDSMYRLANRLVTGKALASNYIALSSNAIKRHNFREALEYAFRSMENTNEQFGPSLMAYDAAIELGEITVARQMLRQARDMDSFDYLVRLSKFQDYLGDLDSAISIMEKAYRKVQGGNIDLVTWTSANLADMYGHAGRIHDAYEQYLQVLKHDPMHIHAMNGIAWIAYSADGNISFAHDLANHIASNTELPDIHLFQATLARESGNIDQAADYEEQFIMEAEKPEYGSMYAAYLVELYIDRNQLMKAEWLATKEVEARPTPLSYSLLAQTRLASGKTNEAYWIVKDQIEGQTYEPMILFHSARVMWENGQKEEAETLFSEVLSASFEVGPDITRETKKYLAGNAG